MNIKNNQPGRIFPRNRMEHWHKITIWLILYDIVAVNFSYAVALWLRFDCQYTEILNPYMMA